MCGIFGYAALAANSLARAPLDEVTEKLFLLSETRGKEAAGIALQISGQIGIYKDSIPASDLIKSRGYKQFLERMPSAINTKDNVALLGHTRLVTNGFQVIDENNQPVRYSNTIGIHNGIIVNHEALWNANTDLNRTSEVDSQVAVALVQKQIDGGASIDQAIRSTMAQVRGETSLGLMFADRDTMVLATNTGSLYLLGGSAQGQFAFVSEEFIAQEIIQGSDKLAGFENCEPRQLRPGEVAIIDLATLAVDILDAEHDAAPNFAPKLAFIKEIEEKSQRTAELRDGMRRCTKCILPETMPYIEFDAQGVCNYCHSYIVKPKPDAAAVAQQLQTLRTNDSGSADSILAFSGGRDSSYGMHVLIKDWGLKPLAYTYDWGMVTDLGRRNQSRMCGELGVEHIWVSANISQKRANIRRNVNAWLKKPNLGMIPLFMAGDKQFFYYANKTKARTKLDKVYFCINPLERTDFKSAFSNVYPDGLARDSDSGAFSNYNLSAFSSLSLASYYGREMLLNPRYLNRSLFDTAFAYASYYLMKQPFTNVFDYLEWDEATVDDTLINTYGWETSPDTPTTWRIGDGTAPFYNYVYHQVAGFSEFDTFRSNQIREGSMERGRALELVAAEHMPRWDAIQEYCHMINVDIQECLRVVNQMPRLYDR